MKRELLILIIGMLFVPMVFGQSVPSGDSAVTQQMIQEHKNTRKFVSDELTRQRNEFNKEFEDRAEYYKKEADDLISKAVWKLGLMWGGIVIFVFGISNFLGRKLDKRKWNKMLESAKAEILADVTQQKQQLELRKQQVNDDLAIREAQIEQKIQQVKKAKPQLIAMQQKMQQQQQELQRVMGELQLFQNGQTPQPPQGMNIPPPPAPHQAMTPPPAPAQPQQKPNKSFWGRKKDGN